MIVRVYNKPRFIFTDQEMTCFLNDHDQRDILQKFIPNLPCIEYVNYSSNPHTLFSLQGFNVLTIADYETLALIGEDIYTVLLETTNKISDF